MPATNSCYSVSHDLNLKKAGDEFKNDINCIINAEKNKCWMEFEPKLLANSETL